MGENILYEYYEFVSADTYYGLIKDIRGKKTAQILLMENVKKFKF